MSKSSPWSQGRKIPFGRGKRTYYSPFKEKTAINSAKNARKKLYLQRNRKRKDQKPKNDADIVVRAFLRGHQKVVFRRQNARHFFTSRILLIPLFTWVILRARASAPHDNVCMYGHTYSKSMDQSCKVASPARGQLNRKNEYFPVRVRV